MSGPEADLGAQADLITDELMNLLIDNYKNEDDFDLNAANEQPDEEEFKDKFSQIIIKFNPLLNHLIQPLHVIRP